MMKMINESKEKLHWQRGWPGSKCKIIQGEREHSHSRKNIISQIGNEAL